MMKPNSGGWRLMVGRAVRRDRRAVGQQFPGVLEDNDSVAEQ
jgi:hypothetical protein